MTSVIFAFNSAIKLKQKNPLLHSFYSHSEDSNGDWTSGRYDIVSESQSGICPNQSEAKVWKSHCFDVYIFLLSSLNM